MSSFIVVFCSSVTINKTIQRLMYYLNSISFIDIHHKRSIILVLVITANETDCE